MQHLGSAGIHRVEEGRQVRLSCSPVASIWVTLSIVGQQAGNEMHSPFALVVDDELEHTMPVGYPESNLVLTRLARNRGQ